VTCEATDDVAEGEDFELVRITVVAAAAAADVDVDPVALVEMTDPTEVRFARTDEAAAGSRVEVVGGTATVVAAPEVTSVTVRVNVMTPAPAPAPTLLTPEAPLTPDVLLTPEALLTLDTLLAPDDEPLMPPDAPVVVGNGTLLLLLPASGVTPPFAPLAAITERAVASLEQDRMVPASRTDGRAKHCSPFGQATVVHFPFVHVAVSLLTHATCPVVQADFVVKVPNSAFRICASCPF